MDENYNHMILVIHGKLDAYIARLKKRGNRTPYARIQAQFVGSLARLDVDYDMTIMHFLLRPPQPPIGLFSVAPKTARWVVYPHTEQ